MAWRWNARRLIVSAFVLFHLSAICHLDDASSATSRITLEPLLPVLRAADAACGNGGRSSHPSPFATRWCWTPRSSTPRGCGTSSSSRGSPSFPGGRRSRCTAAQVHRQHGSPEYYTSAQVHGPLRGAANGSQARVISALGEPLLSGQGYAPAGCDGGLRPMAPAADPHARAIRVCLDRGGDGNESASGHGIDCSSPRSRLARSVPFASSSAC